MHTQQRTFPRGHSLDKSIVKGCMQRTRGLACILLGGVRGMGSLARAIAGDAADTSVPVTAAYIHLPFCKRKCFYCDFPVEALGRNIATQCEMPGINSCNSLCHAVCAPIIHAPAMHTRSGELGSDLAACAYQSPSIASCNEETSTRVHLAVF